MIAAIEYNHELHVIKWVGRVKLHVEALTFCNLSINAAEGTFQVTDATFASARPVTVNHAKVVPCSRCRALIAT